jgi:nicotinate phosphoribosyltransferase
MKFNIETAREAEKGPIIKSFLDLDHYKLTMGQFAFHRYPDVIIKYLYTNRTKKIRLAEIVEEKDLRRELDAVQNLRPTQKELAYLATLKNNGGPLFKEDYLQFLANPMLPDYKLKVEDGQFVTEFKGPWKSSIYWETFDLSIKNELFYRALMKNLNEDEIRAIYAEGEKRLESKIELFNKYPGLRFIEFGTRRRFSRAWQEYVVERFKGDLNYNQMIGTSNVNLAMKLGLAPKGTMAHETFMIMSGIMHKNDDEIRASHNQVLREWWDEYGADLSIALTDTYGSDFFFKDMTPKQAKDWKGLRQDSGKPPVFAEKEIKFYDSQDIDPKTKFFVPSDGLDEKKMVYLYDLFGNKLITVDGYGTNGTNDMGFPTLSHVVKAAEANGHGTVKLSDNPAKTMGKPEDVQRFMRIFEYDPKKYQMEECRY